MGSGHWGRVLFVHLTNRQIEIHEPPEEVYRQYLGGYGLGVHYLYRHGAAGADPLGPENILGFVPGLLTGSGAPFSGRFMVVGRSPLTGATCPPHPVMIATSTKNEAPLARAGPRESVRRLLKRQLRV